MFTSFFSFFFFPPPRQLQEILPMWFTAWMQTTWQTKSFREASEWFWILLEWGFWVPALRSATKWHSTARWGVHHSWHTLRFSFKKSKGKSVYKGKVCHGEILLGLGRETQCSSHWWQENFIARVTFNSLWAKVYVTDCMLRLPTANTVN